jgi:hypothetical protein
MKQRFVNQKLGKRNSRRAELQKAKRKQRAFRARVTSVHQPGHSEEDRYNKNQYHGEAYHGISHNPTGTAYIA